MKILPDECLKAILCAKERGWDPWQVGFEDVLGLVVWKPPHEVLLADTVRSVEEIDAISEGSGYPLSTEIQAALKDLPRRPGELRVVVICLGREPAGYVTVLTNHDAPGQQ